MATKVKKYGRFGKKKNRPKNQGRRKELCVLELTISTWEF